MTTNMNFKNFETNLNLWLTPYWETATPGLCLEVYHRGQKIFDYQGGEFYPYYDLSSLTKVLFTVPAMIMAMQKGFWNFDTKVKDILAWWPHPQTKIIELLSHTSGLLWWKAFYKDLETAPEISKRWEILKEDIIVSPINIQINSIYSDLGFMTLAYLIQELWQQPLHSIWDLVKTEFAPQSTLHWIVSGKKNGTDLLAPTTSLFPRTHYAPTEICPWRKRRLQGEVHDENAWILGGLSTHAGLFGNPGDVASVFLKLRSIALDQTHSAHHILRSFMQRQIEKERGDWALGFMMPTLGASSSGNYFSNNSIGHTGFTGTSVWWDVDADVLVVLLTNRVYYGREQRGIAKLRPLLHDKIIEQLIKEDIK